MAAASGEFPVGKVLSFLVVLALTALPVVSCGPLEFKGHEILRNEIPDFEGLEKGLGEMGRTIGAGTPGTESAPPSAPTASAKPKRDTLFPPSHTWMWFLYIAIFVAGVASFFVRSGHRARVALGAFGAAGLLVFLNRFQDALMAGEQEKGMGIVVFDWDAGAWIALIGFALILFDGLRAPAASLRVID